MRFTLYTALIISFSLVSACKKEAPGINIPSTLIEEQLVLVDQLNATLTTIESVEPTSDFSDFEPLEFLADARIVGMGEATHGTKDFFQAKDKLFRYLVTEHGFTAFAFEMDFAEAMMFNDYILGQNVNTIENLMRDRMIFWTWRTEEVRDLLVWMKAYNESVGDGQMLTFYGFDCQFFTYNIDFLVERLTPYNEDFANELNNLLWPLKNITFSEYPPPGSQDHEYRDLVEGVYQTILDRESEISTTLSGNEYELILQLARTLVQTREVLHSTSVPWNPVNFRDKYMAENTEWVLNRLGDNSKIAAWAHNNHVADFNFYDSMGKYLKAALGESYQVVGFGFSTGYFQAVKSNVGLRNAFLDEEPPATSVNHILHNANQDNFILDFKLITPGSELAKYFTEEHLFLNIGAVYNDSPDIYYDEMPLSHHYDALIYIDDTEAAVRLE